MKLIDNTSGNYRFLTGIAPYFELRDEDMGVNAATGKDEDRNLAFTFGASYGF